MQSLDVDDHCKWFLDQNLLFSHDCLSLKVGFLALDLDAQCEYYAGTQVHGLCLKRTNTLLSRLV